MRGAVFVLAGLFNLPVLWRAFVDQDVSVQTAVVRFLIALPIAAILVGGVRLAIRRSTDVSDRSS
jgi:hypothetical protein